MRALFAKLRAEGVRLALATSGKGEEVERDKRLADIRDLVDVTVSSDDAERSKPDPDIFRAALARLRDSGPLNEAAALAVGDTPDDARSAAGAGIGTIGLL